MIGLTCREMTDFLADYLDGSLGVAERHLFDEHLAGCPECIAYLRSYAETIRLARQTRGRTTRSRTAFRMSWFGRSSQRGAACPEPARTGR